MSTNDGPKKKVWKKTVKRALLGVGAVAALFSGWVYGTTESRLHQRFDVKVEPVAVPNDYASIARGEHVVRALAKCTDCHGDDLGGGVIVDNPLVGRLAAPNLTSGPVAKRSDEDLLRALAHGVAPDGRPLVIMPAHEIGELGAEDLGAVIAYLRTATPVERETPPMRVGPMIRVLFALDQIPLLPAEKIDHEKPRRRVPPAEPTPAYGEYLAKTGGCFGCHGPELAGGPIPGLPPGSPEAADIRREKLASWSFEDFDRTLRTGVRPDGRQLADLMPWRATAKMTDVEMRALYAYLESPPQGPTASR